jgi:hypothetical protein
MTNPTLAGLIARRDDLKGKIDSHLRFDPGVDAPGDQLRDELGGVIGAITQVLHEPFRVEAERLTSMRAQIAQELLTAQHQRTQLRCRQGATQGQRSAAMAAGDDPAEHTLTSKAASASLADCEAAMGELEARLRGVDAQLTALTVAEGAQIMSGVSAA